MTTFPGRICAASALLLLAVGACSPPDTPPAMDGELEGDPASAPVALSDAERALASLEMLLLDADSLSMTYDVRSTGAFDARLSGQVVKEGAMVGVRSAGHFGETTVNGAVVEDGGRLEISLGDSTVSREAPVATWPAVALGLTRMGILHNLARLTQMQFPDHADGGVEGWVRADNVRLEDGEVAGGTNIVFDIIVDGRTSGEATLVLGSGGLPVQRRQRVDFGEATMEVLERYTWIRVPVEPGTADTFSF